MEYDQRWNSRRAFCPIWDSPAGCVCIPGFDKIRLKSILVAHNALAFEVKDTELKSTSEPLTRDPGIFNLRVLSRMT